MKNKNLLFIIISMFIIFVSLFTLKEIVPIVKEKEMKKRVFNEFDNKISELEKSVIGIIPKNELAEYIRYKGIGSGVIFEKQY